jgi:hypothetical protein
MTPLKARECVAAAIKRGDLVRQPCEVCGIEKTHAHHDDYDKPVDVRWLCSSHHHEAHGKTAGGGHRWKRPDGYNPPPVVISRKPGTMVLIDDLNYAKSEPYNPPKIVLYRQKKSDRVPYEKRTTWPKWWVDQLAPEERAKYPVADTWRS